MHVMIRVIPSPSPSYHHGGPYVTAGVTASLFLFKSRCTAINMDSIMMVP
jgi:hypothetical protein